MTEEFRTNLRVFKEMNGGAASYNTINSNLDKFSQGISKIFQDTDKLCMNEQQNDQSVIKTTGNPNAMTSFANSNQAELNQMGRKFFHFSDKYLFRVLFEQ